MSTQHTPGPWHAHVGRTFEIRAGQTSLADMRLNGHNAVHGMANAQLIAAAPELLAALHMVAEDLFYGRGNVISVASADTVRAAIAKATGG